jgi:hypothetical protein
MNFCVEYAKLEGVGKKIRRQQLLAPKKRGGILLIF